LVKEGDIISLNEKTAQNETVKAIIESNKGKMVPGWLQPDWDNLQARVASLPTRQDITIPVEEHLIVELYSNNREGCLILTFLKRRNHD